MSKSAMTRPAKRVSRLHSTDPTDAAWRRQQAQVDADIEGLSRDTEIDRFVDEMDAAGIEPRERIKRLKAYIRRRVLG
jgi:hypothetical protein